MAYAHVRLTYPYAKTFKKDTLREVCVSMSRRGRDIDEVSMRKL